MRILSLLIALSVTVLAREAVAQRDLSPLHARIATVCPIDGVSIGSLADRTTWRAGFRVEATAQQRAAAQAIIDAWTEDDWEGTLAERRAKARRRILELHSDRAGLTIERDYWQSQGATARVSAIQALLDQAQAQIDALRPQS
jgi:hypothetical protein